MNAFYNTHTDLKFVTTWDDDGFSDLRLKLSDADGMAYMLCLLIIIYFKEVNSKLNESSCQVIICDYKDTEKPKNLFIL